MTDSAEKLRILREKNYAYRSLPAVLDFVDPATAARVAVPVERATLDDLACAEMAYERQVKRWWPKEWAVKWMVDEARKAGARGSDTAAAFACRGIFRKLLRIRIFRKLHFKMSGLPDTVMVPAGADPERDAASISVWRATVDELAWALAESNQQSMALHSDRCAAGRLLEKARAARGRGSDVAVDVLYGSVTRQQ